MMEEKEKEIWVGENRIYFGENDTIYVTLCGEIDERMAYAGKEAGVKLMNGVEGKVNVLIDINNARKPSSNARKMFYGFGDHNKVGKIALFGLHPVARILASFFMGLSKKKDMRFFNSKEEALNWLEEGE